VEAVDVQPRVVARMLRDLLDERAVVQRVELSKLPFAACDAERQWGHGAYSRSL
jgi:hypothetical protein